MAEGAVAGSPVKGLRYGAVAPRLVPYRVSICGELQPFSSANKTRSDARRRPSDRDHGHHTGSPTTQRWISSQFSG